MLKASHFEKKNSNHSLFPDKKTVFYNTGEGTINPICAPGKGDKIKCSNVQ